MLNLEHLDDDMYVSTRIYVAKYTHAHTHILTCFELADQVIHGYHLIVCCAGTALPFGIN